ncbi:erythromycin biosynthesis sensory transduction protein eryC1 [Microbacterium sp. Leaf288]|uniref:DegT/DnrJ/EryC1/StrS family aminotransferase n=1 Tax=Microbacterium sp. Leaf288 TaxID=1736323 RepID=UPI0006F5496B|nr:DegT/DnrJ/EryC1/StrS family aminotransferase [Microbacterium sp. Leaf288]KQP73827.1 erythromycin biosynthesis sensory transduction protein eryC1 [Microbacterium sp. Leaf288]
MNIPLVDLRAQAAEIADEVEPQVLEVLRAACYVGGPHVAAFEREFAEFVGVAHAIGVANGTDAVELALRAVGVGAGDEVIMPANTFIATAEAASRIGAIPVPADVDRDHLLISPDAVAAAITERTRAIVPVHLYGQVAPVEALEAIAAAANLPIVEDGAQSQGATRHGRCAGSIGAIAATSFYPGKNLGASGDAGAVTTDDPDLAKTVRLMANHGSATRYVHDVVGMNSRLDAIHAVTLRAKLARLNDWNARRREASDRYAELLADVPSVVLPQTMPGNSDVWHLYVIRVAERDRVLAELTAAGVGAGVHYPDPWYLTRAYAHLGYQPGAAPIAERAASELLSLPMHPHLTREHQVAVATALRNAVCDD